MILTWKIVCFIKNFMENNYKKLSLSLRLNNSQSIINLLFEDNKFIATKEKTVSGIFEGIILILYLLLLMQIKKKQF